MDLRPMLARLGGAIPVGSDWPFEVEWHGALIVEGRRESNAYARSTEEGRRIAATRPMSPNTPSAAIAIASERFPVATTETRIVPATAVPKDEPRLEMLRERPEISPWSSSGKLGCTTFTDGVSMPPTPRPISSRPGTKARWLDVALTTDQKSNSDQGDEEPATISFLCEYLLARRSAARDETRMPSLAAVKRRPVLIAL
jgi:hypothetical protein